MEAHYDHPSDGAPQKYACQDACGFILSGDTALNILKKTAAEHAEI
jgi:hypothetical protein